MGFWNLFLVALMPVLKTLLITLIGLFLAMERVNLLGPVARYHFNNLVFYLFTPLLVGANLASTVTASSIASLWFMPVNVLITFAVGSALGWILAKISRTPKKLQGLVIGCCASGNMGNLLLIIVPSVCAESNSPFGDVATCSTNGKGYASLSMAIGAVYIWLYVYNVVRAYGGEKNRDNDMNESSTNTEPLLSKDGSITEDNEAQIEQIRVRSEDRVPRIEGIKESIKSFAGSINWKMVFAPSTIATIVGLFLGVVSPIRNLLIGTNAPLRVIESSAILVGDATIPSMTLVVGANLLKGLKKSNVSIWVIIGVQVVKYIAVPLVGILVVKGAHHFGWVGSDPLYEFILLLQYAVPIAMAMDEEVFMEQPQGFIDAIHPDYVCRLHKVQLHSCLRLVRVSALLSCCGIMQSQQSLSPFGPLTF